MCSHTLRTSIIPLCILFFYSPSSGWANNSISPSELKQTLLAEAIQMFEGNELNEALLLLDSLSQIHHQLEDWDSLMETSLTKASWCAVLDEVILYRKYLQRADSLLNVLKSFPKFSFEKFSIKLKESWGGYFHTTGQIINAIGIFESLFQEQKQSTNQDIQSLKNLENYCANLGLFYFTNGDYQKANHWYNQALDYSHLLQSKKADSSKSAIMIFHIGKTFLARKAYTEANEKFQQSLRNMAEYSARQKYIPNWIKAWRLNVNLAIVQLNLETKKSKAALSYLQKSIGHQDFNRKQNKRIQKTYGKVYVSLGQYDRAIDYFNRALEADIQDFGFKNPTVAIGNLNIGKILFKQKHFEAALDHFQMALNNLSIEFNELDFSRNPTTKSTAYKKHLLEILNAKTDVLWKLSQQNPTNPKYLNAAREAITLAVEVIDVIKRDYISNSDKQFLVAHSYPIFEKAIAIALADGNESLAFEFSEKSKAVLLLEAVNYKKSIANHNDPLFQKEKEINIAINHLLKIRYSERQGNNDQNLIRQYEMEIASLKEALKELRNEVEEKYPSFFQSNNLLLKEVQESLGPKESTIAYFVGDQNIYAFLVLSKTIKVFTLSKGFDLEKTVEKMLNGIYAYHLLNQQDKSFASFKVEYLEAAKLLYDSLFAPLVLKLQAHDIEKIKIIPDDVLCYIPFGALISEHYNLKSNFGTLSYLEFQYVISYGFSATLQKSMVKDHDRNAKKILLAIAPDFIGITSQHSLKTESLDYREVCDTIKYLKAGFGPLLHNIKEAMWLVEHFGGKPLVKENARIDSLKNLVEDYRILHFSTHGKSNNKNGDFSFLVLKSTDAVSTDNLYVNDIYNLQLHADMVFLSACETAIGELQKGEGLVSLGRAFAHAGAKSIITSLWSVEESSTLAITKLFYQNLKKGLPKDEALQLAKKELMNNNPDPKFKNPFYWAAFTAIGDMKPLPYLQPKDPFIKVLVIGSLVIFTILFLVGNKIRRKNKT